MPTRPVVQASVTDLVLAGERSLRPSASSRLDAELLLAHVLGADRTIIYRDGEVRISADHQRFFERLILARAGGKPIAQLIGVAEFWSLPFLVDTNVLIPRPETELLVEIALELLPSDANSLIADLGTGTGAIAIVCARERPGTTVVATDRSAAALQVARRNCERHGVERIALLNTNWMDGLRPNGFDLILSNPPYVAADDPLLWDSDIRFEPIEALAAGDDGLAALRTIVRAAPAHLKAGGFLVVEHGYNQGAAVRNLFDERGFQNTTTAHDLAGSERVTYGEKHAP